MWQVTWMPQVNFVKVFDGVVSVPRGVSTVALPLDLPFYYAGGNLCVMTVIPMDTQAARLSNLVSALVTSGTNRSRYYVSDSTAFNFTQTGIPDSMIIWHYPPPEGARFFRLFVSLTGGDD